MADDKRPDPSAPSLAYSEMAPKWKQIDDLMGGTSVMRQCGREYLPQHPSESTENYNNRLNQTILYNVTELTRDSLVGRVFKEEMRLNKDVPKAIEDISENIDLQNNSIPTFCVEWFADGVTKGFSHVLIDMPKISAEERAVRTLADDKRENNRPFWSLIRPENLIFAHFDKHYGVERLTQIRIVEVSCEISPVDGLSEIWHTDIRVIKLGEWEVWRNINENQKNRKPEWTVIDRGTYDLPEIPLITFYAGSKKCNMVAKPPLEDLGYLNVRHWQSSSDQINILTVSRFPLLAASGTSIEASKGESGRGAITIGPRSLLTMREPNGKFYYVEHNGKSIASGQAELDGLVDQMSAYGSEFLRRQIAGRTATERVADGNEATSPLKRMAIDFKASVERALKMTARWINVPEEKAGTVTINTKFTEASDKPTNGTVLTEARKRMDLSRETFINEMVRTGQIDQTINAKEEIARIKAESDEGPMNPSYITATENIRAVEQVAPASASDIASGDNIKPAAVPTQPARLPDPQGAKLV